MQSTGNDLFAGAGFSANQHIDAGFVAQPFSQFLHFAHGGVVGAEAYQWFRQAGGERLCLLSRARAAWLQQANKVDCVIDPGAKSTQLIVGGAINAEYIGDLALE